MKKIDGMDVFRSCAAMGIMLYHYFFIGPLQGFYSKEVFIPLAFFGEWGVDIFFLISGFFILQSVHNRNYKTFFMSRIKRIYPSFIVGSFFVLLLGIVMPNTQIRNLIYRWIVSLLMIGDLTSSGPLSSIYWTLFIEIRFYVLVTIILFIDAVINEKCIKNKITLNKLLFGWLAISILNTYWISNKAIEVFFVTKYAGHFIIGIILYRIIINNKRNASYILLLPLSTILLLHNILGYTQWIRGAEYQKLAYSESEIFGGVLILLCTFVYFAKKSKINPKSASIAHVLSAISFPFYLVHADFGFFIRTMYYKKILFYFSFLQKLPSRFVEYGIMLIAIVASFLVAFGINKLVSRKYIKP